MKFWDAVDELGVSSSRTRTLTSSFLSSRHGRKTRRRAEWHRARRRFPRSGFHRRLAQARLNHLHRSQAGWRRSRPGTRCQKTLVAEARMELFEIREGILK